MKHIDKEAIQTNLPARVQYITDFLEFGPDDADTLHAAAPILSSLVPTVVDAVYLKLFDYDITKRVFLPRENEWTNSPSKPRLLKSGKTF
jgi:hypothetical protein